MGHPHPHHEHEEHEEHEHSHAVGVLGFLQSMFRPHSHDAADSIDDALEGSTRGIWAVKVSLFGLGATSVFQLVIVLASGSVALLADTIHNLADASTAIPLWIAFSLGRRAANRRYTYGYGRAEDLAGVFVVFMISLSALVAAWESVDRLIHPQPIDHLGWVAFAGVVGFVGNEAVAVFRIRVGHQIGSAALVADGYHARTDGFTSLAVLLGALGVWLGFPLADPLVGLLITGAILIVLKDAGLQIWRRMMDAVDPETIERAEAAASRVAGVQAVSEVRARWIGHSLHSEVLIVADADLSLADAHAVAERTRHAMMAAVPKLGRVTVHVDPCGHDGRDHHPVVPRPIRRAPTHSH
jgi:cation diffusion facilitator family transporter